MFSIPSGNLYGKPQENHRKPWENGGLPSDYVEIAIEKGNLQWIYPLNIAIFYSYVNLPEGIMVVLMAMGEGFGGIQYVLMDLQGFKVVLIVFSWVLSCFMLV